MTGPRTRAPDVAASPALRFTATALWLAGVVLAVAMLLLRIELDRMGVSDRYDTYLFATLAGVMLAYGSLGRFLVARRSRQLVGWIFLATPIGVGIVFGGFTALDWASATGRSGEPIVAWIGVIAPVSLAPTMFLAFPALALAFPDGRLPGPRWRWPVRLLVAAMSIGAIAALIQPGPMDPKLPPNPIGLPFLPSMPLLAVNIALGYPSVIVGTLLGIAAILVRVHRGSPDERRQLAWFLGAVLVVVVVEGPQFASENATTWTNVLGTASLTLVPAATTVAILRYHLYDIDRIFSRTLAYAIVTAVLVAVFAGAVLGLQAVLSDVTGGDTAPVALSTLLVLSLFQPLRARVQAAVDRRFHRARVDAARAIDAFGLRLRDETDLATVRSGTLETAASLMRPASAGLWLRAR
jgi:hypothetical protein